jgi:nicotinate dehydrogenase subunit A
MRRTIAFTLNGRAVRVEVDDSATLLDVLRNDLGLMGTRFGCGAGQCGACAVLIDGEEKPACTVEMGLLAAKSVVTVEGLGDADAPHPLQTAFIELQAGQCGYCLSGVLIGAKALLDRNRAPSRAEIAAALSWHLCRCGIHNRMMEAVALAARRIAAETVS